MTPSAPLFVGALSVDPVSERAESQALEQLLEGLGGRKPDLLMVFVSHHHGGAIEGLGPRLEAATRAQVVLGCTGETIIGGTREVEQEPALSLWAAVLPDTELRPFQVAATPGADGEFLFDEMPEVELPEQASLLLLADPYSFPMDAYLQRLNEELPGVPAVGGMASGGMGPGQNLLLTGRGLVQGGAVGVVLEGGIEVLSVVSQGCRPIGAPWVVTAGNEQVLEKMGGLPAFDVLMKTLEDLPPDDRQLFQQAPFIGLAIDPTKSEFERGDFLVRSLKGVQPKERTVVVNETLRRGQTVQFLVRDASSASEDLSHLMHTRGGGKGSNSAKGAHDAAGALLFSCNGRGTRMFEQSDHDVTIVRQAIENEVPVAGFFAMGEIGPVGGRNFLHGFTASVVVFRQRAGV